jgi:hypothetical protein
MCAIISATKNKDNKKETKGTGHKFNKQVADVRREIGLLSLSNIILKAYEAW